MLTQAIYLTDPYQKSMDAKVVSVALESPGMWRLILDQTVFYPMGGGQPTDQGTVLFADGTAGEVNRVLLKDGEINHYVKMAREPLVAETLQGTIDWERRFKHMKIHSAAHVIDFAMFLLGFSPHQLKPLKGDHGKKPFIIYQGTLGQDIRQLLEEKSQKMVADAMNFSWSFQPLEELQKCAIYLQPGLPIHKPLRCLSLEGVGAVADGGTIVANTREVGLIKIPSIEEIDGNTHVHYQVT